MRGFRAERTLQYTSRLKRALFYSQLTLCWYGDIVLDCDEQHCKFWSDLYTNRKNNANESMHCTQGCTYPFDFHLLFIKSHFVQLIARPRATLEQFKHDLRKTGFNIYCVILMYYLLYIAPHLGWQDTKMTSNQTILPLCAFYLNCKTTFYFLLRQIKNIEYTDVCKNTKIQHYRTKVRNY